MIASMVLRLPRLARKTFRRQHERTPCSIAAEIFFIERGFRIRGVINEISLGGARFRPAQTFILTRSQDAVRLGFLDHELQATLMNTSGVGYGLKLKTLLTQDELEAIVGA